MVEFVPSHARKKQTNIGFEIVGAWQAHFKTDVYSKIRSVSDANSDKLFHKKPSTGFMNLQIHQFPLFLWCSVLKMCDLKWNSQRFFWCFSEWQMLDVSLRPLRMTMTIGGDRGTKTCHSHDSAIWCKCPQTHNIMGSFWHKLAVMEETLRSLRALVKCLNVP